MAIYLAAISKNPVSLELLPLVLSYHPNYPHADGQFLDVDVAHWHTEERDGLYLNYFHVISHEVVSVGNCMPVVVLFDEGHPAGELHAKMRAARNDAVMSFVAEASDDCGLSPEKDLTVYLMKDGTRMFFMQDIETKYLDDTAAQFRRGTIKSV
jgi:hypothetical protein